MTLFDDIDVGAKKKRIEELVSELNCHSYRYYVLDSPEISDADYDTMNRELVQLEHEIHYILPNSPTQRVGYPIPEKFKAVKHAEKLYSLDNAFTGQEVHDFYERVKKLADLIDVAVLVDIKYDGLTLSNAYTHGILTEAATRGDGIEG